MWGKVRLIHFGVGFHAWDFFRVRLGFGILREFGMEVQEKAWDLHTGLGFGKVWFGGGWERDPNRSGARPVLTDIINYH